jgi:hypothetical protein
MSTPEVNTDTPTFESKVKTALSESTVGEDGKTVWPEGTAEEVVYAATSEKRFRDTQSSFTKGQQQLKVKEEESKLLRAQIEANATINVSAEDKAKLDEMKYQNPEGWRDEMNKLETENRNKLKSKLDDIGTEATKSGELVAREQQLDAFLAANPGLDINDEVIGNDIPPRITNKLAKGEVTFGEFLENCKEYLGKGKVIAGVAPEEDQPNLTDISGSNSPSKAAVNAGAAANYDKEIY